MQNSDKMELETPSPRPLDSIHASEAASVPADVPSDEPQDAARLKAHTSVDVVEVKGLLRQALGQAGILDYVMVRTTSSASLASGLV